MLIDERPIEPGDLIVLAVSVVVAALGAAAFVAGKEHRHALAQKQRGEEVFDLALANGFDAFFPRGAFDAEIRAVVIIVAIAVAFAVIFVVLERVADQVVRA